MSDKQKINLNLNIFKLDSKNKSKTKKFSQPIAIDSKDRICYFCQKNRGCYVCPQCSRAYCNSECFRSQKHFECSEHFFKKMVIEHLRTLKTTPEEKRHFLELLKRNFINPDQMPDYLDLLVDGSSLSSASSGSISSSPQDTWIEDLEELKDSINLDWIKSNTNYNERMCSFLEKISKSFEGEDCDESNLENLWSKLTIEDRQEFIDIVEENDEIFQRLVPIWKPWWLQTEWETILIEEIPSNNDTSLKSHEPPQDPYPQMFDQIEPLSKLLNTKTPSSVLPLMIMSTCFVYCYLCRYHNGEIACCAHRDSHHQDTKWSYSEIIEKLFHLLPFLDHQVSSSNSVPSTPFDCLEFLTNRWLSQEHKTSSSNQRDPMEQIMQRKLILKNLFQDLRIVMDWQSKPGRKILIKIDSNKEFHPVPKAIALILSDLIYILNRCIKAIKKSKNYSKPMENKSKLLREKLKFYLSYTIENGHQVFNGDPFLKALDFHIQKLAQESQGLLKEEE